MDHEFNLVKLIRNVRNMKIFIKKELISDKQKSLIKNSQYNIINIDDENDINTPSSDSDNLKK